MSKPKNISISVDGLVLSKAEIRILLRENQRKSDRIRYLERVAYGARNG